MSTETLMTEGQNTTGADQQQAATSQTEGQTAQGGEQEATQQQTTEGQAAQTQEGEGGKTEGEEKGAEQKVGAPEQYEFKAPEGQQFDAAVIDAFSEVAKELNLPQEAAQKVLDKVAPVIANRQAEQLQAACTEWADTAKADKEFGGDKLTENLAVAKKGLDTFGTPELRTLLNESGLGNHPEVIRAFYRAGKAISEDRVITGTQGAGAADPAKRLFPNQK